jgi:3-dehydroquinate dehydratase/shikimate dehydrogenase
MKEKVITTDRLILRQWRSEDLEPFARLNADPLVREYFSSTLNRQESDRIAKLISDEIDKNGYGFWALSVPHVSDFVGFVGIRPVDFESHFTPAVEMGWRLAHEFWGRGYATEGALAALKYGFQRLKLDEIVAFTAVANARSRNVMEKIYMHRSIDDDFDHPQLALDDPLRRHVLYRIRRTDWESYH